MIKKRVAILMGSDSDLPVVAKAQDVLDSLDIPYTSRILSAHRTPDQVTKFASEARDQGYGVIIAAAGKAAHLAGVIAANTSLPVIGIPIKTSDFGGMDSLLSTVQMPKGIPVATVAVNGSENAAILAGQILALSDPDLKKKLNDMRKNMEEEVLEKDKSLKNTRGE